MWDMPMMKCTKSRDSNELCEWDQALLEPRVITNVLNNITSQGSTESCVLVCTILPFEIERLFKAIEESMFNDAHIFTWYKKQHECRGLQQLCFCYRAHGCGLLPQEEGCSLECSWESTTQAQSPGVAQGQKV